MAYHFERKVYEQVVAELQTIWPGSRYLVLENEYGNGWMVRTTVTDVVYLDLASNGHDYFAIPIALEAGRFTALPNRRPYSLGLRTTSSAKQVAGKYYGEIRAVWEYAEAGALG